MSTLYLDRKDLTLVYSGQCLTFYEQGSKQGSVPLKLLERVVIRGNVKLESRLLGALADQGVGVLMLSGRQGRSQAMLFGAPHNDARRRLVQYAWFGDSVARSRLSTWLVTAKVRAQKRSLRLALAERPDLRRLLKPAIDRLDGALQRLNEDSGTTSLETLRGIEGAAAAAYFKAFTALFPPALAFTARKRRPPTDPVNACLSLGYTLLHFDAVKACHENGLDALLGFYHDPAFGRESLACDFIEPLRADLDAMVWRLFRKRILSANDFSDDNGRCLLGKAGRKRFYAEYELFARPVRRLLRRYGRLLARWLLDAAPEQL